MPMARHIFVDNSNIYGGAQDAGIDIEPEAVWRSIRLHYRNFFQLIEKEEEIETRILAGSVPPDNEGLWHYARKAGYKVDLLRRVENDDGRLVEQSVDETLHLRIANAIIDYPSPQTLVIASGDGKETPTGSSFPAQIERALKQGWFVEVWSWNKPLSPRFQDMASNSEKILVKELDPFYKSITFLQPGVYYVEGSRINVEGRRTLDLPSNCS